MQIKQNHFSENLKNLSLNEIKNLSDDEIYNFLRNEIGIAIGPLVQTTRSLYEKILADSINYLDNIEDFLINYTKTSDETNRIFNKSKNTSLNYSVNKSYNNSKTQISEEKFINQKNDILLQNNFLPQNNEKKKNSVQNLNTSSLNEPYLKNIEKYNESSLKNESNIFSATSPIVPEIRVTREFDINFDYTKANVDSKNFNDYQKKTQCSTPIEKLNSLSDNSNNANCKINNPSENLHKNNYQNFSDDDDLNSCGVGYKFKPNEFKDKLRITKPVLRSRLQLKFTKNETRRRSSSSFNQIEPKKSKWLFKVLLFTLCLLATSIILAFKNFI